MCDSHPPARSLISYHRCSLLAWPDSRINAHNALHFVLPRLPWDQQPRYDLEKNAATYPHTQPTLNLSKKGCSTCSGTCPACGKNLMNSSYEQSHHLEPTLRSDINN